jgi:hypothetical protein
MAILILLSLSLEMSIGRLRDGLRVDNVSVGFGHSSALHREGDF